mmetsp:Transcript_32945/g.59773  ORF Transcript_32945/g.59773 Transcript_32945/m.59773 type:complete len:201 (-) Transcript_32945:3505-4107(-)
MAENVPNPLNTFELTLHGVHDDLLIFAVHNYGEARELIEFSVIHVPKHGVHETEGALRVLAQHLVQYLSKTSSAYLDSTFGDCMFDGRAEHMARLSAIACVGAALGWSCLFDHAQVDAGSRVTEENQDGDCYPETDQTLHDEQVTARITNLRIERRQIPFALANHPLSTFVQLRCLHRSIDCHVVRREACWHQEVRTVGS